MLALLQGESKKAEFLFMDGPYQIDVQPADGARWLLIGHRRDVSGRAVFREEFDKRQVIHEVIRASRQLLNLVKGSTTWDSDCAKLQGILSRSESAPEVRGSA
jgi:hypothetical protein